MNAFETFIQNKPYGFLKDSDIPELVRLHRLCQCLVRCGGCRFICAAQDLAHLEKCIVAGGDYIRDVAITSAEIDRAAQWQPEPPLRCANPSPVWKPGPTHPAAPKIPAPLNILAPAFNEADCGGVFDGNQVISDAEGNL